ncbi:MAG: prepilin-type N-terminal cleavage/methylation domain-containing protein [Nitrospiraceae bacterium]|nr:MAG: prepilin-type N-terminal cleavage/methylation domain-containing protein [Nitrospiraceae bacterium]
MEISNFKFQISNPRRGFTLIELLIVLFIIGIASGLIGIIISRNSGNFELKNLAKDLSAVLRYARNQAITEKKMYCFFIDSDERMYRLYAGKDKDKEKDDEDEEFVQVLGKPIPGEMRISVMGKDPDSSFIEFFPAGNSTGGVVEVVNMKGAVYNVMVNRITGKVETAPGES